VCECASVDHYKYTLGSMFITWRVYFVGFFSGRGLRRGKILSVVDVRLRLMMRACMSSVSGCNTALVKAFCEAFVRVGGASSLMIFRLTMSGATCLYTMYELPSQNRSLLLASLAILVLPK